MLPANDRQLANQILEELVLQRSICGIGFYGFPVINFGSQDHPGEEESFLRIESSWLVQPTRVIDWPEIPRYSSDIIQLATTCASWRDSKITKIELGLSFSDLHIGFDNGNSFYISGNHPEFESWEFTHLPTILVSLPGGGIAIYDGRSECHKPASA